MMLQSVAGRALSMVGLVLALFAAPGAVQAQESTALAVGDRAPAFEARDDKGKVWRSKENVGKRLLVVYFYPGALTGGCTKQACAFRDNRSQLSKLGANVIGVSGDKVETLKIFKGQNRLNFPLLSDADGRIAKAFGVPVRAGGTVKSTVDGKEVTLARDLTTARWTFVIDQKGNVVYRDTQVDPVGDSERVIAAIRRIQGQG